MRKTKSQHSMGLWRIMLMAQVALASAYANSDGGVVAVPAPHVDSKIASVPQMPSVDKAMIPSGHMLPTGFSPQVGNVTMSQPSPTQMVFNQTSHTALSNFTSFDIGPGHRVDIHQPSQDSIFAARVTGPDPSVIMGTLKANGHVWLMNRSGIMVGDGAKIDANLLGTTKNISNRAFKEGRYIFKGNSDAKITLEGKITMAAPGKWLALAGNHIEGKEDLLLAAPSHRIMLAGVEAFSLDLEGDGLFGFKVNRARASHEVSVQLAHQSSIKAEDGYVLLKTQDTEDTVKGVIHTGELIEATKITTDARTGIIRLEGGEGTEVKVGGALVASGKDEKDGKGGKVFVTGSKVILEKTAKIEAKGATGGGRVVIGGANPKVADAETQMLRRAEDTVVEAGAKINTDALVKGDGGQVEVWGDHTTRFEGHVSARGGQEGGKGANVEVSGGEKLILPEYAIADLRAPKGKTGTLLIDPNSVTIADADPGGGVTWISPATILTNLGTANYTIATSTATPNTGADATKNILINSALDLSSVDNTNTLTLEAGNSIGITAPVTLGRHNLYLKSGMASAAGGPSTISFAGSGEIATTAGQGIAYLYYHNAGVNMAPTDFSANITGGGAHVAYRWLTNEADWTTMVAGWTNGVNPTRTFDYALRGNITVDSTSDVPGDAFTGYFDGNGKTITLDHGGGTDVAGLFKEIDNADTTIPTVQNLTVTFGTYDDNTKDMVGGIANMLTNGYLQNNTVNITAMTGQVNVGGLVGRLVNGILSGNTVTATGSIVGGAHTGGLVGFMDAGTVEGNTIASIDSVQGTTHVGGLVGRLVSGTVSDNTITDINSVTATADNVGGLVGYMDNGTVSGNTIADINSITTTADSAGGLVGRMDAGAVTGNTITSITTLTGRDYVAGAVGFLLDGTIGGNGQGNTLTHIGDIAGRSYVAGLVGRADATTTTVSYNTISNINNISTNDTACYYIGGLIGAAFGLVDHNTATIIAINVTGNGGGSDSFGGLVGFVQDNTISNNTLTVTTITGTDINRTGGLIGYAHTLGDGSTMIVSNNTVSTSLTGTNTVGGLIGELTNGVITGNAVTVPAAGTLSGGTKIGGLIGYMLGGTLGGDADADGNTVTFGTGATLAGTGNDVGGLVGHLEGGTVEKNAVTLSSTGSISGAENVGGAVGWVEAGTVDTNTVTLNRASIASTNGYTGGLFGRLEGVSTNNVLDTLTRVTSGGAYVGGMVGRITSTATFDSTDTITTPLSAQADGALIAGTDQVGGLVGQMETGTLSGYEPGYIFIGAAGTNTGGAVGSLSGGTVELNILKSYLLNASMAGPNVGGIIGEITTGGGGAPTVQGNTNTGAIKVADPAAVLGGIAGSLGGNSTDYFAGTNTWNIDATPIHEGAFDQTDPAVTTAASYHIGSTGDTTDNTAYSWPLGNGAILANGRSAPSSGGSSTPSYVTASAAATQALLGIVESTSTDGGGDVPSSWDVQPTSSSIDGAYTNFDGVGGGYDALSISETSMPAVVGSSPSIVSSNGESSLDGVSGEVSDSGEVTGMTDDSSNAVAEAEADEGKQATSDEEKSQQEDAGQETEENTENSNKEKSQGESAGEKIEGDIANSNK